jgi:hypothetical protein
MRTLDLRGARVTDISPLHSCTALARLYLSYCHVDIEPLAALVGLDTLVLVHNERLTDIGPLAGMRKLCLIQLLTQPLYTDHFARVV